MFKLEKKNETITEYFQLAKRVYDQLAALRHPISVDDLVQVLTNGWSHL